MKRLLLLIVRGYQLLLRPVLPPACRFSPSCSQYSLEAINKYGALKGAWLSIKRIIRCNPWNPGGYDPVP
jgi:putative membrane protein insertion efficiency factor